MGYRKQCPTCRRAFTHPPAFTIHRKSCGDEKSGGASPRGRVAAMSPRARPVNPLSVPPKPPPATKRQRQLAAREELSISLEMVQAAYAADLEALTPKPPPPQGPTLMDLDAHDDDADAEMARQLQRELNGFRGRSPRREPVKPPVKLPVKLPVAQPPPKPSNPAASTLVGQNICRRAGTKTVTTGSVTQRLLRDERLKYQVAYTDGRVEELDFEQLKPLLEATGKNVGARFMSMPGDADGSDTEPEEPKEIRVGEDYQCTVIPEMLTTTPAGAELSTVGTLVWNPGSVSPEALSSYLSVAADENAQSEENVASGTPPTSSLTAETPRKQASVAAAEHLLHHLHSHAYDIAAASSSARAAKPVNGAPRLGTPMQRVFEDAVEKHGKDFRLIAQIMNTVAQKSVKKAEEKRTAEIMEVLDDVIGKIVADQPPGAAGDDAEPEPRQRGELRVGDAVDVDRKVATEGGRATIVAKTAEGLYVVKYIVGMKEKRPLPAAALSLCRGPEADGIDEDEQLGSEQTPDGQDESISGSDEEAPNPAPGGSWTPEEDNKLIALIKQHGEVDWPQRADDLGTGRSAKACQTRYRNHLRNKPRGSKNTDYGFTGEPVEPITVAELTLWYYIVWKMTPQYKAWHERWSNRNNSECEVCNRAGRLLECSACPASYHPRCCTPKYESWDLAMAESGEKDTWLCQSCRPGPRLTRAQMTQAEDTSHPLSLSNQPRSRRPRQCADTASSGEPSPSRSTSSSPVETTSSDSSSSSTPACPSLSASSLSSAPSVPAADQGRHSPPITPATVPVRPSVPPPPPAATSGGSTKRPASISSNTVEFVPAKKRAAISSETTPLLSARPEAAPKWSPEEDEWLLQSVAQHGVGNWAVKAEEHAHPGLRSASSVGHRWQKLVGLEPERTAEAIRLAELRNLRTTTSSSLSGIASVSYPSNASMFTGAAARGGSMYSVPGDSATDMQISTEPVHQYHQPMQMHGRVTTGMATGSHSSGIHTGGYVSPEELSLCGGVAQDHKYPSSFIRSGSGDDRDWSRRLSLSTVTPTLNNSSTGGSSTTAPLPADGLQLLLQLSQLQ